MLSLLAQVGQFRLAETGLPARRDVERPVQF